MFPRRGLRLSIGVALVLLIALLVTVFVVGALALLLESMGDQTGGLVLGWIAVGCGILVAIDLIFLVVMLGFHCLDEKQPPDQSA